jgi:hypothetical protein
MSDIYFMTFYTEGQPTDKGYNLTKTVIEIKEKLSPFFDDIFIFNKTKLKELNNSEDICNEYEEALDMNPNANNIGYFDFKPFIIDYVLSIIPEHSILVYHDANFEKNPQYWESDWKNIKEFANKLFTDNTSDLFVQIERDGAYVKEYVKTYTIDTLIPDQRENSIIKNCKLINAARIILKNTKFSRNFIKEYLNLCRDKTLLAKTPNPTPDSAFKWSCGDQDVLNCLIYKYILEGKLKPEFPIYSFMYRVLRFENKPFNWPGQSWNPHPTGASKIYNEELIDYINKKV